MKRVVNKSKNAKEAENWDIQQQISMSPRERQEASRILKQRVYGKDNPDVKESERKK